MSARWHFLVLVAVISNLVSCKKSTLSDVIQQQLGHVLYKAAYDVLSTHETRSLDGSLDMPGHRSGSETSDLLVSTLDFLSNVAKSELLEGDDYYEDHQEVLKRTNRARRSLNSSPSGLVPEVPAIRPLDPLLFMHDYIPKTGVGNREEIEVTRVVEEPLTAKFLSPPISWRFIRFNSTNYVLSHQKSNILLWPVTTDGHGHPSFVFDDRHVVCSVATGFEGEIKIAQLYSQRLQESEVLRVAIVIRTPTGVHQLRSYELSSTGSGCFPVHMIELQHGSTPLQLRFIASHYESALVVLSSGRNVEPRVDFSQSARDSSTRLIQVTVNNAVDLETFTINGYSFLAVATGHGVELFRLNEFFHHTMAFDSLAIERVTDIIYFRMGFDHFLGVSTAGEKQYLFEFREGSFHLKQTFESSRTVQWMIIEVPTCRDDVLLTLVRDDRRQPVLIFAWNGQARTYELVVGDVRRFIPHAFTSLPFSAASIPFDHSAYVLELDTTGRPRLLSVHTILTEVTDPVLTHTVQVTSLMQNIRERLTFQEQFIARIIETLKFAVRQLDGSRRQSVLLAPITFNHLTSSVQTVVKHLRGLKSMKWTRSRLTLADMRFPIEDLERGIGQLRTLFNELRHKSSDIVFKDRPAFLPRPLKFASTIELYGLNSSFTVVRGIAQFDVAKKLADTFLKSDQQKLTIRGMSNFVHPLRVRGATNVARVNGLDFNVQVALANRPQVFTSAISFRGLNVNDHATMIGRVNGIHLIRDIVQTSRGIFTFSSPVHFLTPSNSPRLGTSVQALNSLSVDGVNVNDVAKSILLATGNQTFSGKRLTINSLSSRHIAENKRLNGQNIQGIALRAVRIDRPQNILGQKTFKNLVIIKSHINVAGTVQRLRIPENIVRASAAQTITGPKHFRGLQFFSGRVNIDGKVDYLRLPADVVSLTGNDSCRGLILQRGVDVFDSVNISGQIDSIDLAALARRALKVADLSLSRPRFTGLVQVRGNVLITGTANGMNLSAIASDAIWPGARHRIEKISGRKTFRSALVAPAINVAQVMNNVEVKSVVKTRQSDSIFSKLVFQDGLALADLNVKNATIGGVNLAELNSKRISLSSPGYLSGGKNFLGQVQALKGIQVDGTVNRLKVQNDLFLKSGANYKSGPGKQVVNGKTRLARGAHFENVLNSPNVFVSGLLDSFNITTVQTRRVPLDKDQAIRSPLVLINSRSKRLTSGLIDDEDIRRYIASILFKTGTQNIRGHISFNAPVTVQGDVNSRSGLNQGRVSLRNLNAFAVKTRAPLNVIRSNFEFVAPLKAGTVQVYGATSGQNIARIAADSVRRSNNGTLLTSPKTFFAHGFRINGNLNANLINRNYLPSSILLKNVPQTIIGKVNFGRVRVSRDLNLRGKVCDIKLSVFDHSVMKTDRLNVLNRSIVFEHHVHVASDIRTGNGFVSGVNIRDIARTALYNHFDQKIHGQTVLRNRAMFMDNLDTSLIGNKSLNRVLRDIVLINEPRVVQLRALNNFSDAVKVIGSLRYLGRSGQRGLVLVGRNGINGMHLRSVATNGLRLHGPPVVVNSPKLFIEVVEVTRGGIRASDLINGVSFPNDVVLLRSDKPQVLYGRKKFYDVYFTKNVDVDGTVNGFRLPALAIDTLYGFKDQNVRGRKTFRGRLTLASGHVNSLNGIRDIRSNFVTTSGPEDRVLLGSVTITKPLRVARQTMVNGLVDGVNLTSFTQNSMFRDTFQTLNHPITFQNVLIERPLRIDGRINGIDFSNLAREAFEYRENLAVGDDLMKQVMTRQIRSADKLFKALETSKFTIDHFTLNRELNGIYGSTFEVQSPGLIALAELNRDGINSTVYQMRFNSKAAAFEPRRVDHNVPFTTRMYLEIQGFEFVVHKASFNSPEKDTIVRRGHLMMGSLGGYVDDVHVMKYSPTLALLSVLSAVKGQLRIYLLKQPRDVAAAPTLKHIAVMNVGPSATRVIAFSVSGEVHIAVARNFKNLCAVADSGSLLFKFDGVSKFDLVQRLQVGDSSAMAYYSLNDQHYLVFADSADFDSTLEPQAIHVYRSRVSPSRGSCQFALFQKLIFDNINDLAVFSYGPSNRHELYMAAVNRTTLQVWRQDGVSGFGESWPLKATGGRAVLPLVQEGRLLIVVGTDRRHTCLGSLVYEARTRGSSLLPISMDTTWSKTT